jgi:hypothetical protein
VPQQLGEPAGSADYREAILAVSAGEITGPELG